MSEAESRAVHYVELAIVAKEGSLVVDGTSHISAIEAELARRALAERAVAEASLLCRYVTLCPSCAWCDNKITPAQHTRDISGRLYHDDDSAPCAQEFEDQCEDYVAEHAAALAGA